MRNSETLGARVADTLTSRRPVAVDDDAVN
jgi:hypothetical protein